VIAGKIAVDNAMPQSRGRLLFEDVRISDHDEIDPAIVYGVGRNLESGAMKQPDHLL
jgi:hypothetical protein